MSSLTPPPFVNRVDAGLQLAKRMRHLTEREPIVVAMAPAGLPVAHEVALRLEAPMGTVLVESIEPMRGHPVGAAAEIGRAVVDTRRGLAQGLGRAQLEALALHAASNARIRALRYPPGPGLSERVAVLVDDSTGNGFSQIAAARALREWGAVRIILATPVLTLSLATMLRGEVDDTLYVVKASVERCPYAWYEDARAFTDDDALTLLERVMPSLPAAVGW